MTLREDAETIIHTAISAVLPDEAVKEALRGRSFENGKCIVVAIGKAAWRMANCAVACLGNSIEQGIVITKYGYSCGSIPNIKIFEAGHPIPDENSMKATQAAIDMVTGLQPEDTVLFLVSGGGSSLFEKPCIDLNELKSITKQLLKSGASIQEVNTIRKRLSKVKAGRFAELCLPARVLSIVLSDIIGDPLDMIASGPTFPDSSTGKQALDIVDRYQLSLSDEARSLLTTETPQKLTNVENIVNGSVRQLCSAAEMSARSLGYTPMLLTNSLRCEAREAGSFFASIAEYYQRTKTSIAIIAGGETVVHVKGNGLGGRNQELVLSAAKWLYSTKNTALVSVGSDGTDGPTDAAGGYVDAGTVSKLFNAGIDVEAALDNNDAYHALELCDGLIFTGATGTNVNDLTVLLIKRELCGIFN